MTTYNIKVFSPTNARVLILSLIIIIVSGVLLFIPEGLSKDLAIVFTALSLIIAYFLWKKFVTGRIQCTVDSEGLKMKWIKNIPFLNDDEISIKWSDIAKANNKSCSEYETFKIELTSGAIIKYFHDNAIARDDYKVFRKVVEQMTTCK